MSPKKNLILFVSEKSFLKKSGRREEPMKVRLLDTVIVPKKKIIIIRQGAIT